MLYRVELPFATSLVITSHGKVKEAGTPLDWANGWEWQDVLLWIRMRGGVVCKTKCDESESSTLNWDGAAL